MIRSMAGHGVLVLVASLAVVSGTRRAVGQVIADRVVAETITTGPPVVVAEDRVRVRYRPRKVVIRERPASLFAPRPRVVRESRFFRRPRVADRVVVTPAPVVESRVEPLPLVDDGPIRTVPTRVERISPD